MEETKKMFKITLCFLEPVYCTDQVLPEPSQTLIILAYALVVTVAGIQQ